MLNSNMVSKMTPSLISEVGLRVLKDCEWVSQWMSQIIEYRAYFSDYYPSCWLDRIHLQAGHASVMRTHKWYFLKLESLEGNGDNWLMWLWVMENNQQNVTFLSRWLFSDISPLVFLYYNGTRVRLLYQMFAKRSKLLKTNFIILS